jgi:hypothetical protein
MQLNQKKALKIKEQIEFKKLENETLRKLAQELENIKKNSQKERLRIKKEYKGLYGYKWSHQRKTWQFAKETVYFDFGDGNLFQRIDNNLFLKITKQDFLKKYLVSEVQHFPFPCRTPTKHSVYGLDG